MIFDQDRILDLIETIAVMGTLALVIFGGARTKQPVTVVVNNYINGVLQQ